MVRSDILAGNVTRHEKTEAYSQASTAAQHKHFLETINPCGDLKGHTEEAEYTAAEQTGVKNFLGAPLRLTERFGELIRIDVIICLDSFYNYLSALVVAVHPRQINDKDNRHGKNHAYKNGD